MPVLTADETAPEAAVLGRRLSYKQKLPGFVPNLTRSPRWWLLAVKGNAERSLAADLQDRKVSYYLPYKTSTAQGARQSHKTLVPLFEGYMFVHADELDMQSRIMASDCRKKIIETIYVKDGAQPVLVDHLRTLRAISAYHLPVKVEDYRPGRACEFILPAVLEGVRTTISSARTAKDGMVLIQVPVSMLGASVFEVPHTHLRLL